MYKVEYIRSADQTYQDSIVHKKGTKVNGNYHEFDNPIVSCGRFHTSKYETLTTLNQYSKDWKIREVTDYLGNKVNLERFTYQFVNKKWKRIN